MKRILICWLVLTMLFTSTAIASEVEDAVGAESNTIEEQTIVEPRYTYIAYMTVGLDIDTDGNLGYVGSARAAYRNLRITVTLQRSTNSLFWEDLESTIKTDYDNVAVDGGRTVPEDDYFYRAKIVTDVFDSNRNIIETATGYSDSERY